MYRFKLDNSSKKFNCPECNRKSFVKYKDMETGDYLPEKYGRCDREIQCSYYLNPYKDNYLAGLADSNIRTEKKQNALSSAVNRSENKEPSFIPYDILKATFKSYEANIFIQNLMHNIPYPFKREDIQQIITMYNLGTIGKGHRAGAITFPFIDIKGNVRAVQAKEFDSENHTISTDFLHSIFKRFYEKHRVPFPTWLKCYLKNDKMVSCLFGEHLLREYPNSPIALVEAPKTALVATLYFGWPENPKHFLWLSVYNVSSLDVKRCKVLQGRKVCLFPDLNAWQSWRDKANILKTQIPNISIRVSDLIQKYSSDEQRKQGLDLADYLSQLDWRKFRGA